LSVNSRKKSAMHGHEAFKFVKSTSSIRPVACSNESVYAANFDTCAQRNRTADERSTRKPTPTKTLRFITFFKIISNRVVLSTVMSWLIKVNDSLPVKNIQVYYLTSQRENVAQSFQDLSLVRCYIMSIGK
jgi:hypothetical protein